MIGQGAGEVCEGHSSGHPFLHGLYDRSPIAYNLSGFIKTRHTKAQVYLMYLESKKNKHYPEYKTSLCVLKRTLSIKLQKLCDVARN